MAKIQDIRERTYGGNSKRPINSITKIARHHSATDTGGFYAFWNGRWKGLGWKTGGYHEIILRDGTVQLCYYPDVITNGILNHNARTYHICVVGNGSFTEAQEKSFEERCKLAMKTFDLGVDDVLGHREFKGTSTACPGIDMDLVRGRLNADIVKDQIKDVDKPDDIEIIVKPVEKAEPKGDAEIKAFQKALNSRYKAGLTVDGVFGKNTLKAAVKGIQTELNKQYKQSLSVDGVFGVQSKKAFPEIAKGARGNITFIIQGVLDGKGHNPKGIDGVFGTDTTIATKNFQKKEKLKQDGVVGPNTAFELFN